MDTGLIVEHFEQLMALAIIAGFGLIYARKRFVVIMPGLMLGALVASGLGLELYQPLVDFSVLAAVLIVFIAGIEIDIDFLRREKEHILLVVGFEFLFLLSLYYFVGLMLEPSYAYVLIATTVASNEAFALVSSKNPIIKSYGITISVLEDTMAVLLLALGFFTKGFEGLSTLSMYPFIALGAVLIAGLFFLAKPFGRLVSTVENMEAKVLLTLLYILILTLISEVYNVPEVLVVFLGAVFLAYHGYDHATAQRMSSYMYLALMGFIVSLPFQVHISFSLTEFILTALYGLILALIAYIIRFLILFISTILGGLRIDYSVTLSLTLANSGEFGLIVLSTLALEGLIPVWLVMTAMFAYAFNLTLVSHIAKNIDHYKDLIYRRTPNWFLSVAEEISSEIRDLTGSLKSDRSFMQGIYQVVILTGLIYILSGAVHIAPTYLVSNLIYIGMISTVMVSLYIIFQNIRVKIPQELSGRSILMLIFRLVLFYLVMAPAIVSLRELYSKGYLQIFNPVTLVLSILLSAALLELSYFIVKNVRIKAGREK